MTPDQQAQALIALVEQDRAARCAAILDEARQRAEALLRQARGEARARMRHAFEEERKRFREQVTAAQARLQTRRRLEHQQVAAVLLQIAWQKLPSALQRRWSDPQARQAWVDRVVASARAVLPAGAWRVVHGPGWPPQEREAVAAALADAPGATVRFEADAATGAGLVVFANGNSVDGSLAGLLSDREANEAMLLHLLETMSGDPGMNPRRGPA